jgi:hypothetical protein
MLIETFWKGNRKTSDILGMCGRNRKPPSAEAVLFWIRRLGGNDKGLPVGQELAKGLYVCRLVQDALD